MTVLVQSLALDNVLRSYPNGTTHDFIIDHCVACNNDTVSRLLTLHIVPSGGTASAANRFVLEPLAPGQSFLCPAVVGAKLGVGDFLSVQADAPSVVAFRVSGR